MNYAQIGLFILFVISVLSCGAGCYSILDKNSRSFMNRSIFLGEVLLIGSIFLVGEMLILSLLGWYRPFFLWGIVIINYAFLLNKNVRKNIATFILRWFKVSPATISFIILLLIFIYRNCYFMVDVDSISTYLFTQKLWLSRGSSIFGGIANDIRIFVPHFDAVPSGLGISIFGQETLFPQLINLFWRLIVLLLVFGYTSYRFNKYYGLAATMLVLFNDHFFYSGVNQWVLINGALIAFLFAGSYNLWESRRQNNHFRFTLALIFLSQLMANKYQMVYVLFFMFVSGVLMQHKPLNRIKEVYYNKKFLVAILVSLFIMSLWYIKNILATADPVFPIFADKLHIFNWTSNAVGVFVKIFGGIKPSQFIKYMNFLFIWPGINAAKYVIIVISLLPLILGIAIARFKINLDTILELCFWLGLSVLTIMGICLFCHQDPRFYRFPLGILSFSAVFSIHFVLKCCFNIRKKIILGIVILLLSLPGYKIIYQQGGYFRRPTLKENMDVLFNRIHMDYAINKHYPQIPVILKGLNENKEKVSLSAWDAGTGFNLPAFLLPERPIVSLWATTIIKWDSYNKEESIINDLKEYGLKWVMSVRNDKLTFIPIEEYAREAVKYERFPKKIFWDYGFPAELANIVY